MELSSPERQDLTRLGLFLEPDDLSPRIPPQLFAGVTIPFPLRDALGQPAATTNNRVSFLAVLARNVAASTAAQAGVLVATIGPGLWRMSLHFNATSDFSTPSPIVDAGAYAINFVSPAGTAFRLLARFPQASVAEIADFLFEALVVNDAWQLTLDLPATGVAQTLSASLTVQAIRLL